MLHSTRYRLLFAPEVIEHLDVIERKYHRLIQQVIDEQLASTPNLRTRNRKPIAEPGPVGAPWELRLGPGNCFRVFYDVDHAERAVWILAIGTKLRERLCIGREEFPP